MGVIYGLYRRISRRRRSPLLTAAFLTFLVFYGTITLWSVSVTRAIVLVMIITLGDAFDRRYDLMTALGAVAMGILILNPWALFGAAFQMSFLAIVSICFFGPFLERFLPAEFSAMLVLSLIIGTPMIPDTPVLWGTVIFLSLFCTGLAFIIQPIAQQYTEASHVGIIYSLEPVFAGVTAFFLAGEILTARGYLGELLMGFDRRRLPGRGC